MSGNTSLLRVPNRNVNVRKTKTRAWKPANDAKGKKNGNASATIDEFTQTEEGTVIMDNWRKITYGIGRSVALGAGLLGWYLAHKNRIPEFMGFVSSGVACASIYAWTTYFFEKTDKNKVGCMGVGSGGQTGHSTPPEKKEILLVNGCWADKEASTKPLMTPEEYAIKRRNEYNKFKVAASKLIEQDLAKKDNRPNFGEEMDEMEIDFSGIDDKDVPLFAELFKAQSGEHNQEKLEKLLEIEDARIREYTWPPHLAMLFGD